MRGKIYINIYKIIYIFIYIHKKYIFILLCFNVLNTVPRENRLADFLYIIIYIYL